MAKFIDLDAINKPIGEAIINGKKYPVHQMPVKNLVNLIHLADMPQDQREPAKYLEESAAILHELIPSCPKDVFLGLTMDQMNALLAWTRSLGEEEVEKNGETPQA